MINKTLMQDVGVFCYARTVISRQWCKRIAKRNMTVRTPYGFEFMIDPNIPFTFEVCTRKWHEDWGTEVVLANMIDGGDFIDVGANIGVYEATFAPISRRVYAFEPDQKFFGLLKRNTQTYSNVHIFPMAVSNKAGTTYFESPGASLRSGGLKDSRDDLGSGTITFPVETTTLDEFVGSRNIEPTCIKIDTDGTETEVLLGAREVLNTWRPVVCTEFGHQIDPERCGRELQKLLSDARYSVFGFVRASRTEYTPPIFVKIADSDVGNVWAKMFLLVPAEKVERVQRFVGANGLRLPWSQVKGQKEIPAKIS